MRIIYINIISLLITGVFMFTATAVFSAEDYNSSGSNTQIAIEINTSIAPSPTTVAPKPISPTVVFPTIVPTSPTLAPTIKPLPVYNLPVIQTNTTVQPSAVSMPVPSTVYTTVIKKCGVNTFNVSNECGVGAFKNLYFQCYDGYEEKLGGENSCKSSDVWRDYARSVCAKRCGAVSVLPIQGEKVPATITTKLLPRPTPTPIPIPMPVVEVKPIAICYIPDKLMKDYSQFILELRKAESAGDKETTELIIKKITALKSEIERARKECLANTTVRSRSVKLSTEVIPPAPIAINRCREVAQWENKIAYYEKLAGLSNADLKEQTGFSREEIKEILSDLPNGLKKVKIQCEDQRDIIEKRSLGTFSTEILSLDLKSIAEPVKPVVVESGREIDDYYKARIEKITSTESTEKQIQNLGLLKEEIDELIAKLIKGRKEMEVSELGNLVTEIKISRGEIRADDVVIKTTGKKILIKIGDKPISIEPTARGVLIRDNNIGDGLEVRAEEISIKDNILRVGSSEVKLTASDVIESISKRPGRTKYADITLKRGIALTEENGRAVYKIKETEPRKLFGFIPIRIIKTLTASAETSELLSEKLPWYAFLTTK